jgi:tetratricopeptide (TPR) repeat protein
MSKSSGSGSALILGLGVTAVFSLSFLFYTFFWNTKTKKNITSSTTKAITSPPSSSPAVSSNTASSAPASVVKEDKKEEVTATTTASASATSATSVEQASSTVESVESAVVVDEDSDEDSDDEDNAEDEAAKVELKNSYDDALRLAKKLLAGEKYFKAAEKFSEAIVLAEKLGGAASNDITTLYNNRSAMYEKCGELELSLTDIGLVLAMDALHLKARVRRARIYEVQNNIKLSCIDYMMGMLIEMTKGQPPSHQEKIEALVKLQAVSECQAVVDSIRNATSRELPSKSHCRNYFETFPSFHRWRAANADRESLASTLALLGGDFTEESSTEDISEVTARLVAVLALAQCDIATGAFKTASVSVAKACAFVEANKAKLLETASTELSTVIADLFSIHGTFFHLRANFSQAKECFSFCLEQQPLPAGFENALRLASVHLEVDTVEDASRVYDSVDTSFSEGHENDIAWLNVHRMSEWITRDTEGKFRPEALEKATACVDKALVATKDYSGDSIKKSCHLMALLKQIQLLSQTKMQMGLQPDNNDVAQQKESIEKAIEMFPQHETVLMLGADLLSQEGKFDEALASCDTLIASGKSQDAILTVVKANVVCQMGMTKFAEAQQAQSQQLAMEAQQLLQQGQGLYGDAIKTEANCIEALIQLAQLKSMMGTEEMEAALSLCNQALPHARSRDEALDIMHLKLMMENRLVAINEMRANGVQI